MTVKIDKLQTAIKKHLAEQVVASKVYVDELTLEISKQDLLTVVECLRDHDDFQFEQLIDLCGVDYLTYGQDEWTTEHATSSGFERGRDTTAVSSTWNKPRFAVVYHLLSVTLNHRIRLKVFVEEENMMLPSISDI